MNPEMNSLHSPLRVQMKTFYSPTLYIYTHICRILEWFSIIKPLIT